MHDLQRYYGEQYSQQDGPEFTILATAREAFLHHFSSITFTTKAGYYQKTSVYNSTQKAEHPYYISGHSCEYH